MTRPKPLLPLFLDVADKDVLVVGGGVVAARKAAELATVGARVRLVAPGLTAEVEELATAPSAHVTIARRAYEESDVAGAWLVFAATDDATVQADIAATCARLRVFCVAVDDPRNASAYGGGVVRRGPVTIAISTSGEAPAVARLLRELIEQLLPEDDWLEAAHALRERWKTEKTPMGSRFAELVRAFKERAG